MESPQTAAGILKLQAPPVEIYIEVDKSRFRCWMHPLSENEMITVQAVGQEALRRAIENKMDPKDATYQAGLASVCQRLFFSIRRGSEPGNPDKGGAPRLFSEKEVVDLHVDEKFRLVDVYRDNFVPTDEERKNSLRERLGAASEILSTSPKGSGSRLSSRRGH